MLLSVLRVVIMTVANRYYWRPEVAPTVHTNLRTGKVRQTNRRHGTVTSGINIETNNIKLPCTPMWFLSPVDMETIMEHLEKTTVSVKITVTSV